MKMDINIGLDKSGRLKSAEAVGKLLASTYSLYLEYIQPLS